MSDLDLQLKQLMSNFEGLQQKPDESAIRDLEEQANKLLKASGGSPVNNDVWELLKEVIAFRRGLTDDQPAIDVEKLLRAARVRIRNATPTDQRGAFELLQQVLEAEPDNLDAYTLLEELLAGNADFTDDVRQLLEPLAHTVDRAAEILRRIRPAAGLEPGRTPPPHPNANSTYSAGASSGPGVSPSPSQSEVEALLARMIDAYYQGEYPEAIKLCIKVLELDPRNATAREYKDKAEDFLERGVVPDTRITLPARIAYNRGFSAKRAGLYEEAQRLFNEALRSARESGIDRWADAENALLEIDDLLLAKRLQEEGDSLAKKDQWTEALEKYEGALELLDTPRARKKYEALEKTIQAHREIDVKLSMLSGQLLDMARQIQPMRSRLAEAREYWADSPKLAELWNKVEARARDISARLQERGENSLLQARTAPTIANRLDSINEAVLYLGEARDLHPEASSEVGALLSQARSDQALANNAKQVLDDAAKLIELRDEANLSEALAKLTTAVGDWSDFVQDARYRSLLTKLQRHLLDLVEGELRERDPDLAHARSILEAVKRQPFTILGRAETRALEDRIERLEQEQADRTAKLEQEQRWKKRQPYLLGAGAALLFLVLLFLTRGVWYPILNPPPTPTPTITPTYTPSPTPTITPTPTNTPTPTPTFTPTATPATELCRGMTKSGGPYRIYEDPDRTSDVIGTAPINRRVRILDQTRDKDGSLWYKIDYGDADTTQIGWIPAQFVAEDPECPGGS